MGEADQRADLAGNIIKIIMSKTVKSSNSRIDMFRYTKIKYQKKQLLESNDCFWMVKEVGTGITVFHHKAFRL